MASLILAKTKPLRLATVAAFYFTQGVPNGLFLIAIPAWIVANGGTATDTAKVASAFLFFWIWKFLTAFVVDRYTFLPMGRRRAWIIGAQAVLLAVLLFSAFRAPGPEDIALLAALSMAAGFGASTQDVAIDGLAVDILEEDERSIAAGLMFGSAMLGLSASAFVAGQLIEHVGVSAAYLAAALVVGLVLLLGILVRERDGERRLPWTSGEAHPRNRRIQVAAWWPLLKASFLAILKPVSIALVVCVVLLQLNFGIDDSFHPVLGQDYAGWSVTQYTNTVSTAGLVAGLVAMTIGGWSVSKIGEPRAFSALLAIFAALSLGWAFAFDRWEDGALVTALLFAWPLLGLMLQVTYIPIAMRLCDPRVAATQFTLYMALGNVGRPAGTALAAGIVASAYPASMIYLVLGLVLAALALLAMMVRFPTESLAPAPLEDDPRTVPDLPAAG